jgi:peroxiredoxin
MKNILSIVMLCIAIMFCSFKPEDKTSQSGYMPGDKAMNFNLKNIDGSTFSLFDNPEARGAIVIFTCNHCPYSKAYEDRIIALNRIYKDLGFPVIAINPNDAVAYPEDSYENMIERAKDKGFEFPYLQDETQEIAKIYGATKTPHVYILSREGDEFVVKYVGAIDDNSNEPELVKNKYVENALEQLLAGQKVSVPFTKAVGCSIKWKK